MATNANLPFRGGLGITSFVLFLLVYIFFGSGVAYAQDSEINAVLCATTGPELQISSPTSDSTVSQPTITLSGEALQTSQLDIYINDNYSESLAIGHNDPNFETTIHLATGTNTIRLEAYYSCNQLSETVELVVTYEPAAQPPTDGEDADTETTEPGRTQPDTVTSPGVSASDGSKTEDDEFIFRLPERFRYYFSFDRPDYVIPIFSWLVLIVLIILFSLALLPLYLLDKLSQKLGWQKSPQALRQLAFIIACLILLAAVFVTILIEA